MRRITIAAVVLTSVLFSGCLVLDQMTTITIHADGSSQLVIFHSNVRSTEQGIKAEEELRRYAAEFDAKTSEDCTRIHRAGGEVTDTHWIRREAPYSTCLAANFRSVESLLNYGTIKGKDDELRITTRFSQEGTRRKLSILAFPPKDLNLSDVSPSSVKEDRQRQAEGISEVRVVVVDGQIVAAQGWTVASDKRSAVLALDEIKQLLRNNPKQVELFIVWEVISR